MSKPEPNDISATLNPSQKNIKDDNHELAFFKQFFDSSPLGAYSCDINGCITAYNAAAVKLWNRIPEHQHELWVGFLHIFDSNRQLIPCEETPMVQTLRDGVECDEILTVETHDHQLKTIRVITKPVFDGASQQIGGQATLINMDDLAYEEKKQFILSAIVQSSENAIISKDLDGVITSWNPGAQRIFGYTEDEVVGKSITILIPEDRMNEERLILDTLKSGRRVDHLETIRLTKAGEAVHISLTVSPVKDGRGNIVGASKIARDITVEVRAKEALKRNTENLEILNAIGKVIVEKLDVETILQKVTDATTRITGAEIGAFFYTQNDENGEEMKLWALSGAPKEVFEKMGMPRNSVLFTPTFNDKNVFRSNDITEEALYGLNMPHLGMPKNHLPVKSYLAVPVLAKSGDVVGSLLFGHSKRGVFTAEHEDLVGSVASQAAVALDNSKLFEEVKALSAKKDEFIALASHELKTPLTSIKGYLQISTRSQRTDMGHLFVDKALGQVEKLNALVSDLLDSSKVVAGKLQYNLGTFDLQQLVSDVIETFHYSNQTHQILFEMTNQTYPIYADKHRIEQVVSNLINNAIKYSPKADKVYVSIEKNAEHVTVRIKDEGIGLTPVQQSKIFTRFYRAEGPSNISGLGLGLYLTKEIIDGHQGHIDVASEFDKGSEFSFSLPLTVSES